MHELSIAMGIANEIIRIAEGNRAKRVLSAHLKIGRGSGIAMDSLRFALEIVRKEYPELSSTDLRIEEVPLIYKCNECGGSFETDDIYFPRCPECNAYRLDIVSGEEMDIKDIEIEV